MIIDNQYITRRKFYAFSHSAKLLYTNFVNEDNRCYLIAFDKGWKALPFIFIVIYLATTSLIRYKIRQRPDSQL